MVGLPCESSGGPTIGGYGRARRVGNLPRTTGDSRVNHQVETSQVKEK